MDKRVPGGASCQEADSEKANESNLSLDTTFLTHCTRCPRAVQGKGFEPNERTTGSLGPVKRARNIRWATLRVTYQSYLLFNFNS